MKALLGFIQIALGIAGIVALFNGQWLAMIGAWVVAFLIGVIGSRVTRHIEGVSEHGRDAIGGMSRALELLRRGEYLSASGATRSQVQALRIGGDKELLVLALTLHAVALASIRDLSGARKALVEASDRYQALPLAMAQEFPEMRRVHALLQREIAQGVPNPSGMVGEFFELTDD